MDKINGLKISFAFFMKLEQGMAFCIILLLYFTNVKYNGISKNSLHIHFIVLNYESI